MSGDLLIPPWLRISATEPGFESNTEVGRSIFTRSVVSTERPGDGVYVRLSTQNASERETDPTFAFLKSHSGRRRGQAARVWYSPATAGYRPRGAFRTLATELLTNNTFANGTTGWAAQVTALSVADRMLRMRTTGTGQSPGVSRGSIAVTQYAPYALRSFIHPRISDGSLYGVFIGDGVSSLSGYGLTNHASLKFVPSATTVTCYAGVINDSTPILGDFLDIAWTSLARCALVDNGQNLLLQSDEFDTTWTATRASVDDQAAATLAPDGTATADSIIEDATASNTHQVSQAVTVSAAAADFSFSVALKAGARTWAHIILSHATGATTAWVNLATGALGQVSNGTDWPNPRAFVTSLGDGWYVVTLVNRKTSAATSITAIIRPTTADGVQAYTGDGTSNIYAWRATLAQSSVPTRLVQTTTTALPTGTAQSGSALHVKGLPASTSGLLLMSDWVGSGKQLCQVAAPLDGDAAQLGYLQLAYPPRTPPADGDPIIVHEPMGRFIANANRATWQERPGIVGDFDYELTEALES